MYKKSTRGSALEESQEREEDRLAETSDSSTGLTSVKEEEREGVR